MITANQLFCHAIGDYVLQSDWMATTKTKKSIAALAHVLTYALPFLFLRPSWAALAVIVSTHFVIDRWRLARYVVWAKNWIAPFWVPLFKMRITGFDAATKTLTVETMPPGARLDDCLTSPDDFMPERRYVKAWAQCSATGCPPDTPAFLAVWLMIITDNLMHVAINSLALRYL